MWCTVGIIGRNLPQEAPKAFAEMKEII